MRDRCVLAAVCFLVALGLLLCVGREFLAKQPSKVPGPATANESAGHGPESAPDSGHSTAEPKDAQPQPERTKPVRDEPANQDPASQPAGPPDRPQPTTSEPAGASGADHQAPAAQSKPAREEKVQKDPVPRPEHKRPAEQGTPVGQQAHDRGKPAEPPGKPTSSTQKPSKPEPAKPEHAKPVHTPREHPQGRPPQGQERPPQGLGPRKPVGQDAASPNPQKEPVDRGPVADPEHQRPTKQPKPPHDPKGKPQGNPQDDAQGSPQSDPQGKPQGSPQVGEETGRPEGAGSQGGPVGLPDKEDTHTPGSGWSGEPPGQSEGSSGHDPATDLGPDKEVGQVPTVVAMGPEGEGSGSEGTTANVPAVGPPPGTGMGHRPDPLPADRLPASASLTGHQSGPDTRSTEGPALQPATLTEEPPRLPVKYVADRHAEGRLPAGASAEVSAPRSAAVRGEDPVEITAAHSSRVPDHQVMRPSRAVETVAGAPEGGGQRSAGYGARPAAGTPFGSTRFFFGYLWDESGYPVQNAQDGPGAVQGAARDFAGETSHRGVLTQRGPPLQLPSPFSGFGLMMGGAAAGASSSGAGGDPLLAVIFCCLCAFFCRGLSRAISAFVRPGTVPHLALERPG